MWNDTNAGRRGHSLMPKSVGEKIASMGTHSEKTTEQVRELTPGAKFFTPMSNWTWYVMEWDAESGLCYGLVQGADQEFGNFYLDELAEASGFGGLMLVERDCYWDPETLGEIMEAWDSERAMLVG